MPPTDDRAPRRRRALGRGPAAGASRTGEQPVSGAGPGGAGRTAAPDEAVHPAARRACPEAVGGPGALHQPSDDHPAAPAGPQQPSAGPPAEPLGTQPGEGAGGEASAAGEAGAGGEAGTACEADPGDGRFTVRLKNFQGPFDLLLQLIAKHRLDVTEVALSTVTDEFIAHIHAMGPDWDLDQATEFLVVAATLLDLKAARLLPAAEVEDEADLALLEARDLLFARLLQYRAYKRIAAILAERWEAEALSRPRTVGLEPHHAELLPQVVISIGAQGFAALAAKAMQPRPRPQVYVDHIHAPLVSVREQAELLVARLRELGGASFQQLTSDAADTLTVVARFLALLELYREKAVALDQPEALGDLQVRWTGGAEGSTAPLVTDEFDREPGKREDRPDEPDTTDEHDGPGGRGGGR